jgi:hypothetical protein
VSTRSLISRGLLGFFACSQLVVCNVSAENPVETWNFFTPVAIGSCQLYQGSNAQETYTIGLTAAVSKPGDPLKVIDVTASGPASLAGIQKDDVLWGSDSGSRPVVIDSCELLRKELSGPKDLVLYHQSSDQQGPIQVIVHPKLRRDVYPGEAQMSWKLVSEFVDGGRFRVTGTLARGSLGDFELRLGIYNLQAASLLQLDESKIFLLDDRGVELTHQPFAEWKQQLETLLARANALARGMESIPYASPPATPPPTHYRISGSADGNYVLTPMGGGAYQVNGATQVEASLSPEYTPSEQIGQAARSIGSIIDAIRIARTNKEIANLRKRAAENAAGVQKLLAAGTASHLETTAPIAPGARRSGAIAFVAPKDSSASAIKAIFVVNDTSTKKDYFITFEFRP